MLWVLLWPYHTLPCLHCTGSLLSYWVTCRYLTFLAVDWLRTVSASRPLCFCLACCLSSRWLCSFSSFVSPFLSVGLCWAVRPLPSPFPLGPSSPWCFLCLVCLPPWVFGLPCFVSCTVPAYRVSSLVVCLACLFVPLGWCLVFLAVDWSRISSIVPSLPQFLFRRLGSFHPDRLSLCVTSPVKTPVWYFWP